MLCGILAEVHARVPLASGDQHVDDLGHCAVGQRALVVGRMAGAAEIITTSCDTLNQVNSPKTALCCSHVGTKQLIRRGLLELGTRDLGPDTG